jgi:uncharacterized protein YjiS (DUF1127 family)
MSLKQFSADRRLHLEPSVSIADKVLALLRVWHRRSQQRAALADLAEQNNHLLADIGLTHQQALCEAAKPFWQQ